MICLTKHFYEQWRARGNGPAPDTETVERMIRDESVLLQLYREAYTARGRRLRFLALYWVPEKDLVFKVDESKSDEHRVVTVLTPAIVADRAASETARMYANG